MALEGRLGDTGKPGHCCLLEEEDEGGGCAAPGVGGSVGAQQSGGGLAVPFGDPCAPASLA